MACTPGLPSPWRALLPVFSGWCARPLIFCVMFSIDTESGFDQVVFITSHGLGEMVVQGAVSRTSFRSINRHWRRIARLSCVAPWGRK
ncbi:PEP/pyruvate-binding domain-containing protein [Shigella flexneri]